ncbi:MAG: 4Fe-4S binding protein [Candidatus Omnitrophica bacterium]|nr:4Fe-4S binding protein [Candidatus Omnitrophota bacterium]
MRIYGLELLRGLSVTLGHFIASYTEGFKRTFANRLRGQVRQDPSERGIFTVQYPEERLRVPERFRVLPVLIFNGKEGEKWTPAAERCTACGICAKVCPPQCIWIVQAKDPASGKPTPKASEFFIDVDVCMNCGLCAEFCPFDAIKMDHTFELGGQERKVSHIFDIDKLHVSTEYYAKTHPKAWAQEEEARRKKAVK